MILWGYINYGRWYKYASSFPPSPYVYIYIYICGNFSDVYIFWNLCINIYIYTYIYVYIYIKYRDFKMVNEAQREEVAVVFFYFRSFYKVHFLFIIYLTAHANWLMQH